MRDKVLDGPEVEYYGSALLEPEFKIPPAAGTFAISCDASHTRASIFFLIGAVFGARLI